MPIASRYSAATPRPIASPTAGVPASNFQGMSLKSERRRWTSRIISPPDRKGGIASSSSRRGPQGPRAHRAEHLVAAEGVEVAAQRLHVDRQVGHAPGRRRSGPGRPRRGPCRPSPRTGLIVPRVLLTWVKATSLGLSRRRTSKTSRRRIPSSVIGMNSRSPSFSWTRSCHGHQVGVVLHLGQHDRVALGDVPPAPGVRHEVDRLGRVAGEDDLVPIGGVDEPGDLASGPARRRRSPPRRSCRSRGGRWRCTRGSSRRRRRSRRRASGCSRPSRGRPAGGR